jgi:putative ABC transport system permease protein
MVALRRKLFRDAWHMRGQMLAIVLVATSGVAGVVTARSIYCSLSASQATYYAAYRFADVFASLKRAPAWLTQRIAAIPGVAKVEDRIVFEVTLDVPGLTEPATGRLVSIPEQRVPMLNDLHLRRGRWVEPGHRDEVLVSEAFAKANRLEPGDRLGAVMNGRWERLRIVGVALSPEYVYEINGTNIFPDNNRFGVLWMSREAMGPAFDMDGAFNDLVLALADGADEADVIARIDHLLESFGGLGAYGRIDQLSHRFITNEIEMNGIFGTIVPAIFLVVVAFLLNMVLARLVSTQRDQIGVLKAFGYRRTTLAIHFLSFGLIASAIGSVFGVGLGAWLAHEINLLYAMLYGFPVLSFDLRADTIVIAVGACTAAAVGGTLSAVRHVFALPPAEAMRTEAPARFQPGLIEQLGTMRFLSPAARIIVRNVTRQPGRALLSVFGIAMAVGIVVFGRYFIDAIYTVADVQFRTIQREDVTVVSHDPLPGRARHEFARLPGIIRSESFRAVPARLRFEHRARRASLLGLEPKGQLRRLIDRDGREVALPPAGVVLTTELARILGVAAGDLLTIEVLEGQRPIRQVPVAGLVDELIGLNAYMDVRALNRMLRESATVSSSLLAVDPMVTPELFARLKRLPAVGGVGIREAQLASFERTIAENLSISTMVMIIFACVIVFAVVYNTSRIALSERGRELASLRVLGFTRGEITAMLLGEHSILTAAAIPVGYALGYAVCAAMADYYRWEIFRLPLVVSAQTYLFAFWIVLGAAIFSGIVVRRRLDRLDLVAVLKSRE